MISMRVRLERKPIIEDRFACYDYTHEALTSEGWTNIKEVKYRQK